MKIIKTGAHGILLPELNIGFDYSGPAAGYIFISHAHADHMPRGNTIPVYATANTIKFMEKRGYRGKATPLEFRQTLKTPGADVTFYPAGHILGSAMTFVESDKSNILYTGDCRTPPAPATEGFELPGKVDYLITEATFSLPIYKWNSPVELAKEVRTFAAETLEEGYTPIFLAYNLGKSQEIMNMLAPLGHLVQIHGAGYKLCSVYEEAGIDLGKYEAYDRDTCEGKILIAPGSALNNGFASNVNKLRIAYCSGWAAREASRTQLTVDKLIPLSDHLDFFELIDLCKKLRPQKVFITHTPDASVVQHYLDKLNIDSTFLT